MEPATGGRRQVALRGAASGEEINMPNVRMRQGKSSELQAIGQLMDAGLDCYQPVADDQAIDVVVRIVTQGGTVRYYDVQIKSARTWQGIRGSVAALVRRENAILILFNSTSKQCLWLDAEAIRARFPGTGGAWGDVFLSNGSVAEMRTEGRDSLEGLRDTLTTEGNRTDSRVTESQASRSALDKEWTGKPASEVRTTNGSAVRVPADHCSPIVLDERGVAYLKGTTAKVIELVLNKEWAGQTPEELQRDMPHLTLGQVYAALAYYHQHKEALDTDIKRRQRLVQRMREEAGPSPVASRLRAEGKLRR